MKWCPHCERSVDDTATACPHCFKDLAGTSSGLEYVANAPPAGLGAPPGPGAPPGIPPAPGAPPQGIGTPPPGTPPIGMGGPPQAMPPGQPPPPGMGAPPQAMPPGQGYPPGMPPGQGYPPGMAPPQGYPPGMAPPQGMPPGQGYPPGMAPPQGYPPGMAPQGPKTSGLAIASLVLGIFGICYGITGLIGLILGIVALKQIKDSNGMITGRGLAIGGIATGSFFVFLFVVGIIAAIAIPLFLQGQGQAKLAEAQANLKDIYAAQIRYKTENGEYAASFTALGWEPSSNTHYAYFLPEEVMQSSEGDDFFDGSEAETFAKTYDFKAVAIANIDYDPDFDIWSINSSGVPIHEHDDTYSSGGSGMSDNPFDNLNNDF